MYDEIRGVGEKTQVAEAPSTSGAGLGWFETTCQEAGA
jgi:hypothetical protein